MNTHTEDANETQNRLQDELSKRGRDVWLAGLGALATVEEEGTKLFNSLVDRGKQFEASRRKEIEEVTQKAEAEGEKALSQLEEAGSGTREYVTNAVNSALERFGVPTKGEVDTLSDKVDALSKQVEALSDALRQKASEDDA